MFEIVARANIHHDQLLKLLKQRSRVHSSLIYDHERINTLEQNICAHIYALIDAEPETLKPEVSTLINAFTLITNNATIPEHLFIQQLIEHYENASSCDKSQENTLTQAIKLICCLLPNSYFQHKIEAAQVQGILDNSYLEHIIYRNNEQLELLIQFNIQWPLEQLQIIRQSALAEQFTPSLTAACLLFSQHNVTAQELAQGYTHKQFFIAKACFVKGLYIDNTKAQTALFNRFAKTQNVAEKADLLVIAGLSGDVRWNEPCTIFCKEYPEHTFNILSFFQHKVFLNIIIELMTEAQTADQAYQAWLLLTNTQLLKKPKLQDSKNKHNQTKNNQADKNKVPHSDQAELIRQDLMQQAGTKILNGISFSDNNASQKLIGIQGMAVQVALSPANTMANGMALYCRQLSSQAFININKNSSEIQGATSVT